MENSISFQQSTSTAVKGNMIFITFSLLIEKRNKLGY